MAADAGGRGPGDPIHRAFEGLVDEEPYVPPLPPSGPIAGAMPFDDAAEPAEEVAAAVRDAAREAAAASAAEVAERLGRRIDRLTALVEQRPLAVPADDGSRLDALREEVRSAVAGLGQQLQGELARLSQGLARETAEMRGELEGLAAELYRREAGGGPAPTGPPAHEPDRLRAEVAAQRKQLRAELEAAVSGLVDPRGETWRGLRSGLEVLLAGSAERLRAEVAHDQDEFRAEMRNTIATVLDRHARAISERLAAMESAIDAERSPGQAYDVRAAVSSALAAHTRAVDDRIARLESALAEAAARQGQEAASTRMELRAEVQAVLAVMDQQAAAWEARRADVASGQAGAGSDGSALLAAEREALAAEVHAALASAAARQSAELEQALGETTERLREDIAAFRREQAAATEGQAAGRREEVAAAVRAAVAEAAEGQARVLGEHSAQLAVAAASTADRVLEQLAALRSESAAALESALAAVIRQQGQAWEARRAELEAGLADTFERVQKVIADEREALELVRSEVVAARLDDPQRIARMEAAVGDLGRRMAELSMAAVEATNRQVEELRQVQNGIFENSRQLYAVLAEDWERAGTEMRALLRQAQRVVEDSREQVRAEIGDAHLRASADQDGRFRAQAAELAEALASNAAEHRRQIDHQTAALEAVLHAFGQRLAEDRRASDLAGQALAGAIESAVERLRGDVDRRLSEVAAVSARASASAEAALAELRAAQERTVDLEELREMVTFMREELARVQRMMSARERYSLSPAERPGERARPAAKKAAPRRRTAS